MSVLFNTVSGYVQLILRDGQFKVFVHIVDLVFIYWSPMTFEEILQYLEKVE